MNITSQLVVLPKYQKLLDTCVVSTWGLQEASRIFKEIRIHQTKYMMVQSITDIPWWFIAGIHHMEGGGDWTTHLANGDPLTARTVQEPAGIPADGHPPFTWEQGAIAALSIKKWVKNPELDWSDCLKALWRGEMYNGWGYRQYHPEVETPYLWSGTNHYEKGKYVADGKWDPNAKSQQVGLVAIWLELGIKLNRETMSPTPTVFSNETLVIAVDTYLKINTAPASSLLDDQKPLQRLKVAAGRRFAISHNLGVEQGHYKLVLPSGNNGLSTVFVWHGHAAIEDGTSPELVGTRDFVTADNTPTLLLVHPEKQKVEDEKSSSIIPAVSNAVINKPTNRQRQDELVRVGLLDPPSDGKWGAISQSAWRAWCRFNGDEQATNDTENFAALQERKGFAELEFRPKDPQNKEHQLAVLCVRRMLKLKMWLAISMGSESPTFNFFYLSGTNPDGSKNKDSIDNWNDLRFLISISADGIVDVAGCWVATWDAGWHYRKSRMNSDGCFQISYDQQMWAWQRGKHFQQYALVQCADIEGYRDDNEDGSRTGDKKFIGDDFYVNHHGAPGDPPSVGRWSAGCGVGAKYASHQKFMKIIDTDRRFLANLGHIVWCCFLNGKEIPEI